ncbi:MAG: GTPase Era [Candidatus Magasanikbacteria bacterium]|jgi:GTP-binding protein Era
MKSGFITLVGRSNVGKSTLLNTLVGTKLAIVTDKPQTTRHNIHGVLNAAEGQAVFVDTPGIFKEKAGPLTGKLTEKAREAIQEIDGIVYVVDPEKPIGAEERFVMSILRKLEIPKILVINKCDLPAKEKMYLDDYKQLTEEIEFVAMYELSALKNRHVEPLRKKVFEILPEGEPNYPPEQLTNLDHKFWVAEIIREKIFLALRKEVPYTTNVEVDSIEEKSDIFEIYATVYTADSRYKKMIIGAGGRAIKEIGIAARKEFEAALGKKVFLKLEVETDKHWAEKI